MQAWDEQAVGVSLESKLPCVCGALCPQGLEADGYDVLCFLVVGTIIIVSTCGHMLGWSPLNNTWSVLFILFTKLLGSFFFF